MIIFKYCKVEVYSPLHDDIELCNGLILKTKWFSNYKMYLVKLNPVDKAIKRHQWITKNQIVRRSLWPEKE